MLIFCWLPVAKKNRREKKTAGCILSTKYWLFNRDPNPYDANIFSPSLKCFMSSLNGVMGPLPNGRTSWLINGGDPNYLRYLG